MGKMRFSDILLRYLISLGFGAVIVCLFQSFAFGVIPPKEGSGAVFPLSREEMIQRDIGQPVAPLPRFLVPDGEGGTKMKVAGVSYVPVFIGCFPNTAA